MTVKLLWNSKGILSELVSMTTEFFKDFDQNPFHVLDDHGILMKFFEDFDQNPGKGQLIWKCPFDFIVWTKIPTKLFLDFCLEFFCSFLGASLKLFGLPGDLVCNIINKETYRKPLKASRKPPGRYKKFQGRNSEIISLVMKFFKDFYQNSSGQP